MKSLRELISYKKIKCLNPEHQDSRPSMFVYDNNLFCFSCGYYVHYDDVITLINKGEIANGSGVIDYNNCSSGARVQGSYNRSAVSILPGTVSKHAREYHSVLKQDRRAFEYLVRDRGISEEVIESSLLGYTGSCYTFPVYDNLHRCVNIRYRSGPDLDKWYGGISGCNEPRLYGASELKEPRIVISEGELDVLLLISNSINAITITNGVRNFARVPKLLGDWRGRVIFCGDQDASGLTATYKLARNLLATHEYLINICSFNSKDITEYWQNGGDVKEVINYAASINSMKDLQEFYDNT